MVKGEKKKGFEEEPQPQLFSLKETKGPEVDTTERVTTDYSISDEKRFRLGEKRRLQRGLDLKQNTLRSFLKGGRKKDMVEGERPLGENGSFKAQKEGS